MRPTNLHRPCFSTRITRGARAAALLLAFALGVSSTRPMQAQAAAPPASQAEELRVAAGDLIELTMFDTPEFSGRLRVSEDGNVLIPVAGKVKLAGLTANEAARAIEAHFRDLDILNDPHASVFVAEYATQGVTVTGEVRNPGIYPMLGKHSLQELISAAGGLSSAAGSVVQLTHRSAPEHPLVVAIDRSGAPIAPVQLLPGDTISVSRSGVVYIVGDVGKAGGFLIEGNQRLTALQALALAQGANRTASENKTRLLRRTPGGRTETPVPLKKIVQGKAVDPELEDGDILYVPSSGRKNALAKGTEAAIAVTSGLIIYGRL
ncbi:MAG: polysaccharide export protein [Acidobacteriota bacterium]|nr:polysaccharide export protein [Acidobacteriota bacterium]